jgi:hypothetical protein
MIAALHNEALHDADRLQEALEHILKGQIRKGKSIGIHFFLPQQHRIAEIIQEANHNGIWEARNEILNPKTQAWVKKKESSTFFPVTWTLNDLYKNMSDAFANKTQVKPYKHIGKTAGGIEIIFIYRNGKIVSCFPSIK